MRQGGQEEAARRDDAPSLRFTRSVRTGRADPARLLRTRAGPVGTSGSFLRIPAKIPGTRPISPNPNFFTCLFSFLLGFKYEHFLNFGMFRIKKNRFNFFQISKSSNLKNLDLKNVHKNNVHI
jgi:hypothetical protein